MRDYSEAYRRAVTNGGKIKAQLDVLVNGRVEASTADPSTGLRVESGSVVVDRGQAVRRTFAATIISPDGALVPDAGDDLLSSTSGNEIAASVGFAYRDGTEELFAQGVFGISDPNPRDQGSSATIELRGSDRSRQVARNVFTKPYVVANGTNGVDAVQALIADRRPETEFRTVPTPLTVPRTVFEEHTNPWQAAQQLTAAFGYEVFFDVDGFCVIQPEPDPSTDEAVWEYVEGKTCSVTEFARPSSNEKAFNGLILVGDSTFGITAARAEVWDTDPDSPTYYQGDYGRYPDFQTDTMISSQAQVDAAAAARFRKQLGAAEAVSWEMVPNPAHDEGDVVRVARERLRLDAKLVMEGFTVPFTAASMPVRTRERRVL